MLLKLTLRNILKKPLSSFFTMSALVVALALLGLVWMVVDNLNTLKVEQKKLGRDSLMQGLTLFLEPTLSKKEVDDMGQQLMSDKRFLRYEIVSPETALKELEAQFGPTLSKVFGEDTLPVTLKLHFASGSINREEFMAMLNKIRAMPGVLDVDNGFTLIPGERTAVSSKVFSWATALLVIVFSLVALLVSHLIRISFETLKNEIDTLKLLGAAHMWIFTPMLILGAAMGILGVLGALISLFVFQGWIVPHYLAEFLPQGVELGFLGFRSVMGLVLVGVSSSLIGAIFTCFSQVNPGCKFCGGHCQSGLSPIYVPYLKSSYLELTLIAFIDDAMSRVLSLSEPLL